MHDNEQGIIDGMAVWPIDNVLFDSGSSELFGLCVVRCCPRLAIQQFTMLTRFGGFDGLVRFRGSGSVGVLGFIC